MRCVASTIGGATPSRIALKTHVALYVQEITVPTYARAQVGGRLVGKDWAGGHIVAKCINCRRPHFAQPNMCSKEMEARPAAKGRRL